MIVFTLIREPTRVLREIAGQQDFDRDFAQHRVQPTRLASHSVHNEHAAPTSGQRQPAGASHSSVWAVLLGRHLTITAEDRLFRIQLSPTDPLRHF